MNCVIGFPIEFNKSAKVVMILQENWFEVGRFDGFWCWNDGFYGWLVMSDQGFFFLIEGAIIWWRNAGSFA
jgi:hypothetical protein